MSKNSIRFYISLAIVFAVFTVIAFVVPFAHNTVFWLSYGFGVIALALQLYVYPKAFDFKGNDVRSKFYGFPLARMGTIYLVTQLVLSLVFMILSKYVDVKTWIVVLLYVLVLTAALLGLNTVDAMRDEVARQDTVHKARADTMRALQSKSALIAAQCDDAEAKKVLTKLADSFRFSDPVSSETLEDAEASLKAMLDELQSAVLEKDYAAAKTLSAKVEAALADRNHLCRLSK